ncbi:MAG TPA: OmpA family protein [Phnomibacter sp.]|nr:OmpA family protein [Phnomibacter sp.]
MKSLFTLLCFLVVCQLSAQWYDPEKVNSKVQFAYTGAIEQLRDGQLDAGKKLLFTTLKLDPKFVDGYLSLGGVYGQQRRYDSAIYFYKQGIALDSIYSRDMYLPYSINLAGAGRFAEAKEIITRFLSIPRLDARSAKAGEYRLSTYNFALNLAAKHGGITPSFAPLNLGDSINSARSEYYPSFTINDSILVYTRRGDGIREDFMMSKKTGNAYTRSALLGGSLNARASKGGLMISQDGEWLIFAGNFPDIGFGDFDLYICYAAPDGWSEPFNLGAQINSDFWDSSPTLSPDKQVLYFSSSRPGGYGGKDLYYCLRQPNGRWGNAENMGPNFNTSADELAPFIHADNQTLFFTSGGHPGYGGSDIYLSRKGPDGQWSIPQNLGYPINTIEEDGSLSVAADGKTAYFASARSDSRGGLDLYRFELPSYDRPLRTLWVSGVVADAKTKKGLPSAIELKNIGTGAVLQKVMTDETGQYLVTLPIGSDYSFTVNRQGYLYYSDRFNLGTQTADSTYEKNIFLVPISLNSSVELKNILFETKSFKLNPASNIELDKLVKLLQDNPSLKLQINGHTDNVGKPQDNIVLSTNRAKAVVEYLVAKGISKTRLSFKGYGATKPIADNKTEQGRAKNRRTELLVVGL